MCEVLAATATASAAAGPLLQRASIIEPPPVIDPEAASPGLLSLTPEEYGRIVRQDPIQASYEINQTPLSVGQWASVYKCRLLSSGAEYVVKYCDKVRLGMDACRDIVHEMAALNLCRHCARIVRLHEVFETRQQYLLVMEFGRGGDLQAILDDNQVPYEADVVRFMRNLLEGLVFIHERNLAHLDIKPQNLVLTGTFPEGDVKLCDLEISRVISDEAEIREMLGTPDYVAPEILRFDPVTLAADMWSVGVLAYVLLTGFTPFGGDTDTETFRNISQAQVDFPEELFEDVSEQAKHFIRACLVKEPRERLTARQSLQHRWLQQCEPAPPPASVHGSNLSIVSNAESVDSARGLRRSASKSREVLYEKISHSNLRKNLSKSRERLCDLRFSLSKSRDRLPPGFRFNMSKSSEVLSSRPPWRAAGVNCPLGTAITPPEEKLNSFKVRDQYHSQMLAGVSLVGPQSPAALQPSPFTRHCSLRGRRKKGDQAGDQPLDFYSSLRRNKKNKNRRNSLQAESAGGPQRDVDKPREFRGRAHSAQEEPDFQPVRPERKRNSRKEAEPAGRNNNNMIIVEIISDNEEEDVFSRLYRDRLKDSELKWRKLKDSDLDQRDEEKENKGGPNVGRRTRLDKSRSPEGRSCSLDTSAGRSRTPSVGRRKPEDSRDEPESRPVESIAEVAGPAAAPQPAVSCSAEPQGSGGRERLAVPSRSPDLRRDRSPASPSGRQPGLLSRRAFLERRNTAPALPPVETAAVTSHRRQRSLGGSEQSVGARKPSAEQQPPDTRTGQAASEHTAPPEGGAHDRKGEVADLKNAENSWRRTKEYSGRNKEEDSTSSQWSEEVPLPAQSCPYVLERVSTFVSVPCSETAACPRQSRSGRSVSVNTEPVRTRDCGTNTEPVLVASVLNETVIWEQTGSLQPDASQGRLLLDACCSPPVATLRHTFERQIRQGGTSGRLQRSSTDEDVRKRLERERGQPEEVRRTAGCRRSSSVSSDLGSSEPSSDAGSEAYSLLCWEEAAAEPGRAVATARPRSHSAQVELSRLRHRSPAPDPWKPLCSGSVARAVERFGTRTSASCADKKRRQSSPNLRPVWSKISELEQV